MLVGQLDQPIARLLDVRCSLQQSLDLGIAHHLPEPVGTEQEPVAGL